MAVVETRKLLESGNKPKERPRTHIWSMDPGWMAGYVTAIKSQAENGAEGYRAGTRHAVHNHRRGRECKDTCILVVVISAGLETA